MISLKKALFTIALGLGLASSMQAWALPDCDTCKFMHAECAAGSASACTAATKYRCALLYPQEFCYEH